MAAPAPHQRTVHLKKLLVHSGLQDPEHEIRLAAVQWSPELSEDIGPPPPRAADQHRLHKSPVEPDSLREAACAALGRLRGSRSRFRSPATDAEGANRVALWKRRPKHSWRLTRCCC